MQYMQMQPMPYGTWGGNMHTFAQQQHAMHMANQKNVQPSPSHAPPMPREVNQKTVQASPSHTPPMPREVNQKTVQASPSHTPPMPREVEGGNNMPSWSSPSPSPSSASAPASPEVAVSGASQPVSRRISVESPPKRKTFRNLLCTSKTSVMRSLALDADVQVSLDTGSSCKPHPNKVKTGGEDAFVISNCNGAWLSGVLDGVGSWTHFGVDSSVYSRTLAQKVKDAFVKMAHENKIANFKRPLLQILETAWGTMGSIKGSCTVCLTMLLPDGKLHVLNLGDSGVRVVRGGKVLFASTEQQIFFNAPRQLGGISSDIPSYSDYTVLDVLPGDLYVVGSDGAWDNLWTHEWLRIVNNFLSSGSSRAPLDHLATLLTEEAQKHGADSTYDSPFAVGAKKAGIVGFNGGGKLDDTTVVVGQVV